MNKILNNVTKFFHKDFDNNALQLIINCFADRKQVVKYNKTVTSKEENRLAVSQGSILGPIFFLSFINDSPFILALLCKLFADNTIMYKEGI